jgi:hypothetical protein
MTGFKTKLAAIAIASAALTATAGCSNDQPAVIRIAYESTERIDVSPPTRLDVALYNLDRQSDEYIDRFVNDCYDMGGTLQADVAIGASICVDVDY